MTYRDFGRTGLQVSPLCLGAMNFGSQTDLKASCAIIDRAVDAGINFIDTANVYSRGRSEEVVGEALTRNGRRDRIVLATKVHGTMGDDDPNAQGISRRHIIAECEASLRRLQTDHIDLYQLHRPRTECAIDESLRALDDLVRAGKVRYIGSSFFTSWKIVEALWASKELGLNRFVSEQPPYNILDRRIERELIPMAQTFSIALMPFAPLASGMLSGKYTSGQEAPAGTRLADTSNWRNTMRISDPIVAKAAEVTALARAKGVAPAAFATAWVVQQPGVTSPIIGPRTLEQLEAYLACLDVEFTAEDSAAFDRIVAPGEHVSPFYQTEFGDFGPNKHRW
jgi:aryl-alcohol dehydrogenase-like predicted oxidoreductase